MQSYPLATQTAYQDLLESHKMWVISDIQGTPFLKEKSKGKYWYARQRIGDRVIDRYIGPNSEELQKWLTKAAEHSEEKKQFERRCAGLVAQLRAAGLPALDRNTGKVLNAMAKVGTFRLGGTLIGTHAFRHYSAELGIRFESAIAVTEDVDVASFRNLKLVIDDKVDPTLSETFDALGLEPAPGLDRKNRPTKWRMKGGGTVLEFLSPRMKTEDETVFLEPLGVYAQALSFLNYLIAEPVPAVGLYRSGVLVQIPRPERYAIHKLIVSQKRDASAAAKAKKDLAQAEALIEVLAEDRPHLLAEAYETAMENGPKWRESLTAALRKSKCKSTLQSVL